MIELEIKLTDRIQCGANWSWESDDNNWSGFHLWCVDGGGAHIKVNDEAYDIIPGDIFLFDLRENHSCTHDPKNPLKVTTVYFGGELEKPVQRIARQNKMLCDMLHQVVRYHELGKTDLALLWLKPVVHEVMEYQGEKQIAESVRQVCDMIEKNFPDTISLQELAKYSGYSKNQLIRVFRQNLGVTPGQYETKKRMESAKGMLVYSSLSVSEIAYQVGYADVSYFTKVFKKEVGISPGKYRKFVTVQ
ncbi:MAG: helix-turn-helix transcriptional regulator [Clostridiales bacterium]|nr:helix-turn-helix transcriptional regulator [Clostridiales bacterium]